MILESQKVDNNIILSYSNRLMITNYRYALVVIFLNVSYASREKNVKGLSKLMHLYSRKSSNLIN